MRAVVAIAWTHPVHGAVAEAVCQMHELEISSALTALGMGCTGHLLSGALECSRCSKNGIPVRNWIKEMKEY